MCRGKMKCQPAGCGGDIPHERFCVRRNRQQVVRFLAFALVLPQPGKAHGRPQLQRLCLLAAGNSEGLLETRLRLVCIRDSLPQQQLTFESMLLHLVTMFPSFICSDERLSQRRQPFLYVPSLRVRCS